MSVHDTEAVLSVYYNTTRDSGEGLQARQTSDLNNNQLRTERVLVWHELALQKGLMYVTSMICRLLTIKTTFLQFTNLGGKEVNLFVHYPYSCLTTSDTVAFDNLCLYSPTLHVFTCGLSDIIHMTKFPTPSLPPICMRTTRQFIVELLL